MRRRVSSSNRSWAMAVSIDSMRAMCAADEAVSCETSDVTLAKMIALTHAPITEMRMPSKTSPSDASEWLLPMSECSVLR